MSHDKVVQMQDKTVAPGSIMNRIGHSDAITLGGGVIFQTAIGPYLEYTEGTENSPDVLEVFRTHIERNVLKQFNVDAEEALDLCETLGIDLKEWLKRAKGINIVDRAHCIVDIAVYNGWDIIDEDPLELTEVELHQRWYSEFNDEGPITTQGCFNPEIICIEMLQAIHSIHVDTYWSLLNGRFPIIPSAARQNRQHAWWKTQGAAAVNRLAEELQKLAPPNLVFEVRDEQFGFWRKK